MTDTIIKDWFLITFWLGGRVIGKVLYGTEVKDNKGRFFAGAECKSSPVEEEITVPTSEPRIFKTLNSTWECVGLGTEYDAPHTAIPLFNAGVRPPYDSELEAIAGLEEKGYVVGDIE